MKAFFLILSTIPLLVPSINCEKHEQVFNGGARNPIIKNFERLILEGDQYENSPYGNDYEKTATKIVPDNFYYTNNYSSQISATLHHWDDDYYYFELFKDSNVEVEISSNTSVGTYSFALVGDYYSFGSGRYNPNYSTNSIYSDYSTSLNKSFNSLLGPGTYIIHLNRMDNGYSEISYDLSLDVEESIIGYDNFTIADLKYNKGLQGACWKADYSILNPATNAFAKDEYTYNIPEQDYLVDYALNHLESLTNNSSFLLEEYFIWGQELKETFADVFQALIDGFFENVTYVASQQRNLQITIDNVNNGISIVTTVAGLVTNNVAINVTSSIIGFFAPLIINHFFDRFVPQIGEADVYYSYVLGLYEGTFRYSAPNVVVYLPIYCRLFHTGDGNLTLLNYKVSFNDTFSIIATTNGIESYSGSIIYGGTKTIPQLPGKVYGINGSQINPAYSLQNITPTPITFTSTGGNFPILFSGGYQWLDFAPSANTTYYFYFETNPTTGCYVELFPSIVSGYSTFGREHVYNVNATNSINGNKIVFFSLTTTSNSHIYFRVFGDGHSALLNVLFGLGDISSNINHVHNYNDSYLWMNLYNHKAFCACGTFHTEGHVVTGYNNSLNPEAQVFYCLLCGGQAKVGFSPYSKEVNVFTENGSYITPDGVIVLAEEDIEAFLNGTLKI